MLTNLEQTIAGVVETLASEIGAEFRAEHGTEAFVCAWARQLADSITVVFQCRYPDKAEAWRRQIIALDDKVMRQECRRIASEITAIDCDDGWPTDKAGAVIHAICIMIYIALEPRRAIGTRWPAEAGGHVWRYATGGGHYNDVVQFSLRAWLRDVYGRAALRAALAQEADDGR